MVVGSDVFVVVGGTGDWVGSGDGTGVWDSVALGWVVSRVMSGSIVVPGSKDVTEEQETINRQPNRMPISWPIVLVPFDFMRGDKYWNSIAYLI